MTAPAWSCAYAANVEDPCLEAGVRRLTVTLPDRTVLELWYCHPHADAVRALLDARALAVDEEAAP